MNTRETLNEFLSKFNDSFKNNIYYEKAKDILSRETLKNDDNKDLHHNLCKLMFADVKSGNEVWIQIDEIYSLDDNHDLQNSNNFVRVSLLNQYMLDYDRNMFQLLSSENEDHEQAREVFRPYFLHFLIDIEQINEKNRAFISDSENLGKWFYGKITEDFTQTQSISEGHIMKGLLESSASPVEYDGKHLIISDRTLSPKKICRINAAYSVRPDIHANSDINVNNYLNVTFNDTIFSTVSTYNVGDGNCIYLHGKSNGTPKRLLYDIGYNMGGYAPKSSIGNLYSKVINAIRSMKPDCVILSHWDLDHIMGCTYAPQRIFQCTWIAPTCTDAKLGAKRLCKYLDNSNKLMLINRKPATPRTDAFARLSTRSSTILFWMGLGAHGGISAINGEGIIIEIQNTVPCKGGSQTINCLLPGDVPYSSLPNGVNLIKNAAIDYFIVPHHGSKMNFSVLDAAANNRNTCAIVSASGTRGNLPHLDHLNKLREKNYHVEITRDVDLFIKFSLVNKYSGVRILK